MAESSMNWRTPRKQVIPRAYDLKKIWNPSWFQGNNRTKNYFEGWYMKMADRDLSNAWAVIPGISMHDSDRHAFVQIIDGKSGDTWYFRYPADAFLYSRKGFHVKIGDNSFSRDGIALNIEEDQGVFVGELRFSNMHPLNTTLARPGIMGWYRYVPFMECYHGVVSLNHTLTGTMKMNNHEVNFDGGKGYTEKDWGSSMPSSWVWMQSNHFGKPDVSFMLSVADIPWLGKSFEGFLGFLLLDGKALVFATYTGAKITQKEKHHNGISIKIRSKDHILQIRGEKAGDAPSKGSLQAPAAAGMDRAIHEDMNATLHLTLTSHHGNILFEDTGVQAGLETIEAAK